MKQEEQINSLKMSIESYYCIQCTFCGEEQETDVPDCSRTVAAGSFYQEGWRRKLGHCLCPRCSEKPDKEIEEWS